MTRRLLGPVGGPILFIVAALVVFGVLGWVTHSALQVEQAQREAAARAELGSNLRVALWRLDGRMLPALGVEDSRPYYHYGSADPAFGYGVASTPLLVTALPDWMKLHFQLDAEVGWDSPQVLCPDAVERMRVAWPDLPLLNCNPERAAVLADLRKRFPPGEALDALAGRDRSLPSESTPPIAIVTPPATTVTPSSLPVVPVVPRPMSENPVPAAVQSSAAPIPRKNVIRILGIDICVCRDAVADTNLASQSRQQADEVQKKVEVVGQAAMPSPRMQVPGGVAQGRGANAYSDNNDSPTRQGTITRARSDVSPPPPVPQPKGQGIYGNYTQNALANSGNLAQPGNDLKNLTNTGNPKATANPTNPPAAGTTTPHVAVPTVPAPTVNPKSVPMAAPNGTPRPMMPGGGGGGAVSPPTAPKSSATFATPINPDDDKFKDPQALRLDKKADTDRAKLEADKAVKDVRNPSLSKDVTDNADSNFLTRWFKRAVDEVPSGGAGTMPPVAPSMENPSPAPAEPFALTAQPPLAIHLGSMRAQWVVGANGAEMLVLVRVARVDNKPICQGILLDWDKLEAMLKDEVNDLFPEAKLLPVKDPADATPDRVMTSLPVQLDPGPQPELPPAGWTALRLGLALAWAAAVIAFVAVGFCGWTLIDLAERRIRFVSAVTHELRTPLTSLRLYLDLLVSGMIHDEAKKQEYLHTLASESDRLHRLIDNVLDFARLEKRRHNGDIKPVHIADLLDQFRQTWTDRLAQENKELVVISTLTDAQQVTTDCAMVQQIVGNLIDNARKYARDAADKRIWVWAKPLGTNRVAIEVEDRGPGVPASERRTVFKPFRRGEHADRTSGGAGLGLALAKSWAEVLGGKLTYRPADGGVGACFRLELPG